MVSFLRLARKCLARKSLGRLAIGATAIVLAACTPGGLTTGGPSIDTSAPVPVALLVPSGSGQAGDEFLAQRQHMLQWSTENSVKSGDPRYSAHSDEYEKAHPMTCSTVERVADHIEHIVKLVGVNHVGFGSDFDGVGDALLGRVRFEGFEDVGVSRGVAAQASPQDGDCAS